MAQSTFNVTIELDFSILSVKLTDTDVPMRDICVDFVNKIRRNIRRGLSYDGAPLRALSPRTIAIKRRLKVSYPERPLYRYGLMYNSIRYFRLSTNMYEVSILPIKRTLQDSITRDKVAYRHQVVGVGVKGIIRPFFGITQQDVTRAGNRFRRWLKLMVSRADLERIKVVRRF